MRSNNQKFSHNALRGRIIAKYGNLQAFADVLGLSMNSLSMKLNNKMGFSRDDIMKISQLLDIKQNEIGSVFFTQKV